MTNHTHTYHDLLWGVRRSIRYHTRRKGFFEGCNTLSNAVTLLFGSGTILTVLKQEPSWAIGFGITVTLASTVNLVVDTTRRAQRHDRLARQFLDLEKELIAAAPSKEMIDRVTLKRLEIEAEEPPILRVVDILCHNELLRAQGYDPTIEATLYYDVSPLQRFFAPLFDIRAHNIKPLTTKPS